jgi:hypothetical protein
MRDAPLAHELLKLAEAAESNLAFSRLVKDRLDLGDVRYGSEFLYRDNLVEATEESADLGAYPILDVQRCRGRMTDSEWGEYRMHAVAVIHAAAKADLELREMLAFRRSILGE